MRIQNDEICPFGGSGQDLVYSSPLSINNVEVWGTVGGLKVGERIFQTTLLL